MTSFKGGSKKKSNGHKMNCGCPICKNMSKSKKRGGGEDGVNKEVEVDVDGVILEDGPPIEEDVAVENNMAGGKRKNKHRKSHKRSKNHRKSRKTRKNRKTRRSKK